MLSSIRRILADLKTNSSGNALLLVALGTPVLIGSSGLAVDSAQYYMWKRDLQFAVDSAALAGAWARTSTATESTYQARALQEYNINVQVPDTFDTGPTTTLVNYNGGTGNAVQVTASATKQLPFSNFITGRSTTVTATARASAVPAGATVTTTTTLNTLTACMIALDPSAMGAFTIGGSASGSVGCGGAALSNHASAAIRENGNPSATFGSLVAGGGIEISLLNNVGGDVTRLKSDTVGLTNPFGSIAQPTGSGVAQTYSCPTASSGTTTSTANVTTVTTTVYGYFVGPNDGTTTVLSPKPTTIADGYLADPAPITVGPANQSVANGTLASSTTTVATRGTAVRIGGSGNDKQYRVPLTTVTTTISGVVATTVGYNDGVARPAPGTYANIPIACTTSFQPGIYVINGSIDFSNNQTVTGSNVLFVMTTANNIANINSNTNIALSGITAATLISSYGYSVANAAKLDTMLFFDALSDSQIKFNGNSTTAFNGIIYMPNRPLWFNGTSAVSGNCMQLVSRTIMLDGTTDLSSFCQPAGGNPLEVRPEITTTTTTTGTTASVKLIQ